MASETVDTEVVFDGFVPHTIASPLRVMGQEMIDACQALAKQADDFPEITDDNIEEASKLTKKVAKQAREIEKRRKDAKAPVADFGKEIDRVVNEMMKAPLLDAKARLANRVTTHEDDMIRRRREAQEAKDKQDREAKERADLQRKQEIAATGKPPTKAITRPVFTEPRVVVPEKVRTGIARTKRTELVILDADKIPFELNGVRLWTPDRAAIKKLQDAGIRVPGCTLDETKGVRA